eukprot:m.578019 g.578019  ORF g.578019 m.578019 type:complete len:686 (+) comp22302_c0_seq1:164-2221(+)
MVASDADISSVNGTRGGADGDTAVTTEKPSDAARADASGDEPSQQATAPSPSNGDGSRETTIDSSSNRSDTRGENITSGPTDTTNSDDEQARSGEGDMDVDDTNASNDEMDDDGRDDDEKSTNSNDAAPNGIMSAGSARTSERQRRVQASPSRRDRARKARRDRSFGPSLHEIQEKLAVKDKYGHHNLTDEGMEARLEELRQLYQRHANHIRRCQKSASGGGNDDDATSGGGSANSDASDTADGNTQNYDSDADEGEETATRPQRRSGRTTRNRHSRYNGQTNGHHRTEDNGADENDESESGTATGSVRTSTRTRRGRGHDSDSREQDGDDDDVEDGSDATASRRPRSNRSREARQKDPEPTEASEVEVGGTNTDGAADRENVTLTDMVGDDDGAPEASGEVFPCSWPGCTRVFDRIKSRSAHLKWHGGNYVDDGNGNVAVEPRTTSSGELKRSASTEAGGSSKGSKRSRVVAPTSSLFNKGDLVVLSDVAFSGNYQHLNGRTLRVVSVIESHDDALASQCKVAFTTSAKGREKISMVPVDYLQLEQGSVTTSTADEVETVGAPRNVLIPSHDSDGHACYRRGVLTSAKTFLPLKSADTDPEPEEIALDSRTLRDTIDDIVGNVADLRISMRVCGSRLPSGSKNTAVVFFPARIHRVEPTRIRVSFDDFAMSWKKISDLRVIKEN